MDAAAWINQLGHACLWGSVWIAAAGLVCRFMPTLPSSLRASLWWLACAEMLVCLCVSTSLSLPILPTHPVVVPAAVTRAELPSKIASPVVPSASVDAASSQTAEAVPTPVPQAPRWPLGLLAVWLCGVTVSFAAAVRQLVLLRRLRQNALPALFADINLPELAQQMGLHFAPLVLTGPNIATPSVTGWLRPVILLPVGLSETLSNSEIHLTLAHEIAHIKRCDLPLALVPMLARALFFFHPLVWWASAEWSAAREEACDARALSATSLPRTDYGLLLLKLAEPTAAAPALGLSPGYHALRRRLLGLSRPQNVPRRARLLVLALPLLLPWRLTSALSPAAASLENAALTHYSVQVLADGTDSEAAALNNAGQIALTVHGKGSDAQGYAGDSEALAALGALPKHHASLAYGLNAQGQVAGTSFNIPGHGRAFVWDGTPHRIGSLPGYPYSEARGLNASGQVAGFSEAGRPDRWHAWISRAFLHQPGEPLTDLGTLGGPYSAAYAINSVGTVVGKADTASFGSTHAFSDADGQMTDLGTLGGSNSAAYAVNDQGRIAGASDIDDTGIRHAFLYADGRMQDLAPLPSMTGSAAYALNSAGQTVGTSQNDDGKRATLWQNDAPTDLNALLPPGSGWTLTEARAVNDHGQIAGIGLYHGHRRAFLLTPEK